MNIFFATSYWFIFISSLLYLTVASAIWLSSWPWYLCAMVNILMLLDLRHVIMYYGLRNHKHSVSIIKQDCDKWRYQLFSGKEYKGKLIRHKSYRSNLVLIMYIRSMTCSRYIVIPRDSLSRRQYRYLALQMSA